MKINTWNYNNVQNFNTIYEYLKSLKFVQIICNIYEYLKL